MTERQRDEMHIDWLERWNAGETTPEIARLYRTTKGVVIGQLHRIRRGLELSEVS